MAASVIEQIKQKLDIVQEIGAVVALRRSGKAYKGVCPFHTERTPSFYVFPETGTWRCFGCNEGGDLFTFVAKRQGLEFRETLALLAEKAGVALGGGDDPFDGAPSPQNQARARLRAMNESAAIWFHHQLLTSSAASYARSYLQSRGISNESIEQFRLGYAPDGDSLTRALLGQGYGEEEIVEAGLARRRDSGGLYDYFRQRLIFTIRDGREQTIGFGARELGGGHPKYLNTPQTILFDKSATLYAFDLARDAIRRQDQAVLVEGYVDALIAHQFGYRNTVAIIGSAITPKHVQQLKKLTRCLVLALDPDAAGEAATLRAIEVAQDGFDRVLVPVALPPDSQAPRIRRDATSGRGKRKDEPPTGMIRFEEQVDADIRIMQLPDGVDPDEYIRHDPAAWQSALDRALPLLDFYFSSLVAGLDLQTDAGKAEAGRRLVPVLAGVTDRIRQDTYVRRLAGLLRISERDVQMELRRHRRPLTPKAPAQDGAPEPAIGEKYYTAEPDGSREAPLATPFTKRVSPGRALEEYAIGLLLGNPTALQEVCAILEAQDFRETETQALFSALTALAATPTPARVDHLLATLPDVLRHEGERLRARYAAQPTQDRASLARNANQIAVRLKRLRLSEAIIELSYLQREAQERGDHDAVRELCEQSAHINRALATWHATRMLQTS